MPPRKPTKRPQGGTGRRTNVPKPSEVPPLPPAVESRGEATVQPVDVRDGALKIVFDQARAGMQRDTVLVLLDMTEADVESDPEFKAQFDANWRRGRAQGAADAMDILKFNASKGDMVALSMYATAVGNPVEAPPDGDKLGAGVAKIVIGVNKGADRQRV